MLAYYSYLVASTVGVGCYYYQATSLLGGVGIEYYTNAPGIGARSCVAAPRGPGGTVHHLKNNKMYCSCGTGVLFIVKIIKRKYSCGPHRVLFIIKKYNSKLKIKKLKSGPMCLNV